jgi:hypothetical protein
VWTLGRKEPSPSDCSPVRRVVHKLLVKKEAALVPAKVRECGPLAISFYPELQSRSTARIQRPLQLRWDRCAKEFLGKSKNHEAGFRRPPECFNPGAKALPEFGIGRAQLHERANFEKYG